jgi:uncharacterized protein YndB with AHSA1/START domain
MIQLRTPGQPRPRLSLERTYEAPLEDVWNLWTTKEGIEAWWGPEGFTVTVRSLDLRPGGELRYVMTATAPAQIAFMNQAKMPLATELKITYTEVVPFRRLGYVQLADFVPGVAPYDVATRVELHQTANGVRMVLDFDAMHDEVWTQRAVMGRESELTKLERLIGRHDLRIRS